MIENNKIESAQKPENGANSKNNTSSGYAHPNNKKRYSAEDYENSHLTDNEIDYNYEFARMTAHGRARQKRDDENAERMTNYISRGNFLTNDEMFDVGKYILVYGFFKQLMFGILKHHTHLEAHCTNVFWIFPNVFSV